MTLDELGNRLDDAVNAVERVADALEGGCSCSNGCCGDSPTAESASSSGASGLNDVG